MVILYISACLHDIFSHIFYDCLTGTRAVWMAQWMASEETFKSIGQVRPLFTVTNHNKGKAYAYAQFMKSTKRHKTIRRLRNHQTLPVLVIIKITDNYHRERFNTLNFWDSTTIDICPCDSSKLEVYDNHVAGRVTYLTDPSQAKQIGPPMSLEESRLLTIH